MKYVLVVGDGMADFPIDQLGGKTPLQALSPKAFEKIGGGRLGRLRSCPIELSPGSDVAFLTLLGNDAVKVYAGRSPLEAAGMGVMLKRGEVAFRMNLAALGEGPDGPIMLSHNGGGVEGADALKLAKAVAADPEFQRIGAERGLVIHPTDTFRHIAVARGAAAEFILKPPHDIAGQGIGRYLPGGPGGDWLKRLQKAAQSALSAHPVNGMRAAEGLMPANAAWFWGAGEACQLPDFTQKYGVTGTVISAVPLVKGIALLNRLKAPQVEGATGLLNTNYENKVAAALSALRSGDDFVLVHIEAPDEMSHDGSLENKLEAIRRVDARVVAPLIQKLPALGDFRLLLMPDHYTLLSTRTHDGTPVPFALYDSRVPSSPAPFTEAACEGAPLLESGDELMRLLFEKA
jgi:2,3-bisphosphoglycerate-independent phosphoglycerate mutase